MRNHSDRLISSDLSSTRSRLLQLPADEHLKFLEKQIELVEIVGRAKNDLIV